MITYQTDVQIVPVTGVDPFGSYLIGSMDTVGDTVILEGSGTQCVVKVRQPGKRQIRLT